MDPVSAGQAMDPASAEGAMGPAEELEMKKRTVFFTKDQSMMLRGIGALMVLINHLASWYAGWITWEPAAVLFSRFGIYGVDLFFLVSGYGLTKSALAHRPGAVFWKNRLTGTYVPYLLIVGLIELSAGGMTDAKDWVQYLTGYDYWFIRNILVFYGIFFAVYRFVRIRWMRCALLAAAVLAYSWRLAELGRADFWYLSNIAFVLGTLLAEWERELIGAARRGYAIQLALLTGLLLLAAKTGWERRFLTSEGLDIWRYELAAGLIWTLFAAQAAGLPVRFAGWLRFLGKISLELYLLHVFLFYQVLNRFPGWDLSTVGLLAVSASVFFAWLLDRALYYLFLNPKGRKAAGNEDGV